MRFSTAVLALACLVVGYLLAGTRVSAIEDQSRRLPSGVGLGSHVVFWFSSDTKSADCTIDRIDAGWVRCASPENGPTFGPTTHATETWYDIAHLINVRKVTADR